MQSLETPTELTNTNTNAEKAINSVLNSNNDFKYEQHGSLTLSGDNKEGYFLALGRYVISGKMSYESATQLINSNNWEIICNICSAMLAYLKEGENKNEKEAIKNDTAIG